VLIAGADRLIDRWPKDAQVIELDVVSSSLKEKQIEHRSHQARGGLG
jgi:hypothetical protein